MTDAIFFPDGDLFVPTDLAASPWGSTLLHGGPSAALLARAIERTSDDPDMQVARLTIDLFRPVPKAPLRVETRVIREGKRIQVVDGTLYSGDEPVTRAAALMLRRTEGGLPSAQPPQAYLEGPEGLVATGLGGTPPGSTARPMAMPGNKGFHTTVEIRRLQGMMGSGGGAAWFRVPVPIVAGEETTPLMRVSATADFGSPMGSPRLAEGIGFINADITLYLHRMPVGEWICLEAKGYAQPYGLGMSETVVHDLGGPIGRVVQATIMNQRQR
jgi:hypothetical protein